ncbi:hypothetical protein [Umezawaea sp. NPDC059074]|uniref:hypothetical protein n=1 Tax=Umezawaea sp. NPDC059074 TaxID=3346716 RepID=UPI0036AF61E5
MIVDVLSGQLGVWQSATPVRSARHHHPGAVRDDVEAASDLKTISIFAGVASSP